MTAHLLCVLGAVGLCVMLLASAWAQSALPKSVRVPYAPGEENLSPSSTYREPGKPWVLRLAIATPHDIDTMEGSKTYKLWYQVSTDSGKTYDKIRPLIQKGKEYNQLHPIRPVFLPKNSFVTSSGALIPVSNGEIMVPIEFWRLDEKGELYNPKGFYTFCDSAVLIGTWAADGSDVEWDLGEAVALGLDQSTSGGYEPAIIELEKPGRFLMALRASNIGDEAMPSYKWKCVSEDYCRTWSEPTPFAYADGERFFSPASCSEFRRHSKTGKVYWFGNITPENAKANHPRYPLVVAEFDEGTLGLVKSTLQVIDTRDPQRGDTEKVEFSNFSISEDPQTGAFHVSLSRRDAGALKPGETFTSRKWPVMRYEVKVE